MLDALARVRSALGEMSEAGHERRLERLPITSEQPRPTDINTPTRLVRCVP